MFMNSMKHSMRSSYKWQQLSPGVPGAKTDALRGAWWRQLHGQGPVRKAFCKPAFLECSTSAPCQDFACIILFNPCDSWIRLVPTKVLWRRSLNLELTLERLVRHRRQRRASHSWRLDGALCQGCSDGLSRLHLWPEPAESG